MTPPAETVTRHHAAIPALDGFRALAVVIVICSHIGLQKVIPGQFGVTLFFFLSGYLITTLLRRELETAGRIDFYRFYLRRAVRILPALYVTIAFVVILSLAGLIRALDLRALPFDIFFLTNYFPLSGIPIGLWSLAVEEHFYLAFPLFLAVSARHVGVARTAAVCAGLCAVVLAIRIWQAHWLGSLDGLNVWTHARIDSILFGSILALWNNPVADDRNVLPERFGGYALAVAFLLPTFVFRDELFRQTLRYTLQGIGLLILFNAAIRDRDGLARWLDNPVARQIAALSYTLYLCHSSIILAFTPDMDHHPIVPTLAALGCTLAYALLMQHLVEAPLNRWRRKTERAWAQAEVKPAVSGG